MADGPPHPVPYNSHLAFTPPPSSNMDPAMDQPQAARQKRLKAGTACTNCRRKKLRCTGTPNCARCVTHNLDCVVDEALFLKTNNSSSSLCSRTPSRPSQSSSSSSSIHHGYPHQSYHRSSKSGNPMQFSTLNTIQLGGPMDRGSMSTSSYSGDEMVERNDNVDYLSDRRLSASSATSFSSLSPSPSPAFSYNYTQSQSHYNSSSYQSSKKHSSKKSSYRSDSGAGHLDSHPSSSSSSRPFSSSSYPGAMDAGSPMSQSSSGMSKKRVSKDQDTVKTKHKRRDSRPSRDSDPGSPSPLLSPQDSSSIDGSMSSSNAKGDDFKSVVSTLSLDGHGQHFHGSSSGFYVCQLSSRYRQGVYPLPMAHLNDSDLWSHSLKMTSESELPSKAEMDNLLGLYFRYMYPFAPMFIRKSFMDQHASKRPDLAQILILNAIFCNACWYSDDPMIKQDSTKYFNRAKIILDETYHVSRVSAVQALLLMSHHQYAVGNYSGGWLYTGMASRIAHDIGLHRQDVQVNEPEEAEIRRRVWWAVYIADRLGGGILGRPLNLRDKEYNVQMPSGDWIDELGWDDAVEYPYEPERIISCRLLWTVKLFMQMGNVLNTMHCIEAEINGAFLADISRTQLPQLHNSLTSWFLSLPNELMYTPYTMSPNSNHPPSPPTALMHMFYYTTLTMLHRPYLRPVNSAAIDANFLVSSRNICTAAATNVCHIADSLMLHGQLRDTCYYGMACLLAAGTVHVHNAITPTPSNRETTRAGLSKTVKAAHELVKTFPVAESLIAVALDVFASQTSSMPTEVAASFIDISTFVAPFMDVTQLQSTSIGNIYEAARLAKLAKDGPGPAPSIQLRHPYGNFSMPLPEGGKDHQNSTKLSSLWQNQIAAAVAMAAIAFGGTDPQQEQQFFANPLELPESLRLAPIDIFQVDATTGLGTFGTDPLQLDHLQTSVPPTTAGFDMSQSQLLQYQPAQHGVQSQSQQQPVQVQQQQQAPPPPSQQQTTQSSIPETQSAGNSIGANSFINFIQAALTSTLQGGNFALQQQQQQQQQPSQQPQQPQQQPQPVQQQQHAMMEDDTADPPSPPAISPDDMDMERASLSSDTPSPVSAPVSVSRGTAPRHDVQTQCDTPSDYSPSESTVSHESFISALSEDADRHGGNLPYFMHHHGDAQAQQQMKEGYNCHKVTDKVNSLMFDGSTMEC